MKKQTVAIIGAGKVGSALARALYSQGYGIAGIASGTIESASKLANEFNVPVAVKAADIARHADIVFVTTPDRYIGQIVSQIANDGGFRPGQFVIHTSGCLPVDVLSPATKYGVFIGCMHPLQAFSNSEITADALVGTYFALSGHDQAVGLVQKMVGDFGGRSFIIADKDKALYHASACIVSNYVVSLMHWATQLYDRLGLSPEQARVALLPLIQGSVENIQQVGATKALTGPISRGDGVTITAHLDALKNQDEKNLYAELGIYTLRVALEKGTLDEQQANALMKILSIDKKENIK